MQCLLELREAQVDTEAERRLEHLQQVGGGGWGVAWGGGRGEPTSGTGLSQPRSPVGHLCL